MLRVSRQNSSTTFEDHLYSKIANKNEKHVKIRRYEKVLCFQLPQWELASQAIQTFCHSTNIHKCTKSAIRLGELVQDFNLSYLGDRDQDNPDLRPI
jgi:hypothetical protein